MDTNEVDIMTNPIFKSEDIDFEEFSRSVEQFNEVQKTQDIKMCISSIPGAKKPSGNYWIGKSIGNLQEVRVILSRLQFGRDGKVIIPEDENPGKIVHRTFTKRNQKVIVASDEVSIGRIQKRPTRANGVSEYILPTSSYITKKSLSSQVRNKEFHQCEKCHKEFSSKYSLVRHYARCLPSSIKSFKCNLCTKAFLTNGELKRHVRIHSDEMPFKCEVCSKKFRHKHNMVEHIILRHQPRGENLVHCNVCNRGFAKKSKMLIHMQNVHIKDNLVECIDPDCKKRFSDKYHMMDHLKSVHKKEFKYHCDECGKGFRDKCKLTNHSRIHTGERPYKCGFCSRTFTRKDVLQSHEKVHTNNYKYRCGICGQGAISPKHLVIHVKLHKTS